MNRSGSTSLDQLRSRTTALEDRLAAAGERLRAHARAAARQANARRAPVIAWTAVSISPEDPVELFVRGLAARASPMLWERPADGLSLVGIGRAWEFSAGGADRLEAARDAWKQVLAGAIGDGEESPEARAASGRSLDAAGLILMGGFSFSPGGPTTPAWDGFAAASLVLPRVVISTDGGEGRAAAIAVIRPDTINSDRADQNANESLALLDEIMRGATARGGRRPDDTPSGASTGIPRGEITGKVVTREEITPAAEWRSLVARAAEAVRRHDLTKVVVARSLKVSDGGFDPARTLRRLKADYPTCTIFAIARDAGCFLGATPERLVRVRGGDVNAMALAGSAPRGRTDHEDRRLGESLLASAKDRVEHTVVVEMLREALDGVCSAVMIAGAPSLLRVSNVQHLYTPITARLRDDTTILDLVGRLHPTPAVGGVPRQAALEWIHRHEGLDRGWYAGPIGWLDQRGDGEFAVAIRSALLAGGQALLYAGCGIVADSDPDAEYEESHLKLRPLLAALGANGNDRDA